jgi:ATP-dependent Clp protease adapter protein ClpS
MSQPPADRPRVPRLPDHVPGPAQPADNKPQRQVPRYKVVLLNQAAHDLMFVVRCVMELTRFPRAEATHKMWQAYHSGRSVLLVTYLERAELYVEQFASKGLKVDLEPA